VAVRSLKEGQDALSVGDSGNPKHQFFDSCSSPESDASLVRGGSQCLVCVEESMNAFLCVCAPLDPHTVDYFRSSEIGQLLRIATIIERYSTIRLPRKKVAEASGLDP
jgi:hypothetical protein